MPLVTTSMFLKKVPLFAELSEPELRHCAEIAHERRYKKHEVIFHAGDHGSVFFILKSGSVRVTIEDRDGREAILQIFYPRDFFGEMALLDDWRRSATVLAMERTVALVIEKQHFLTLLQRIPQLAMHLVHILCRRLRKANERIASLAFFDASGKVAKVFLDLTAEQGIQTARGLALDLNMTRQEIANLAGVSRETLTRTLNEYQKAGVMMVERRRITILNPTLLRREAT